MLLNAAVIRNREGVLSIAKTLKEGEIPRISYHRKCRSIFTLKRDLKKLSQSVIQVEEQEDTSSRRSSIQQPVTTQSRVFVSEFLYFVKMPNTLKEPKLERPLFSVLTFVLIGPSLEQLWVKTIQGYWLLSLGTLLQQKRATISLVIVITLETGQW